jgi:hypothetical protein
VRGRPRSFGGAVGCADCPAMLPILAWRITRYAPSPARPALRSDRCAKYEVEARCARGQDRCASRRPTGASRPAPHRLRGSARWVRRRTAPAPPSRRAAPGRGDLCGGEERSAEVGARQRAS